MRLDLHLAELLYRHDCVVIPAFGGFVAKEIGAEVQAGTHMFRPPRKKISFNALLTENDGLLVHSWATRRGIAYPEAEREIAQQVDTWKETLDQGRKLRLDMIGKLYRDGQGALQFAPSLEDPFLADSFGLGIFRATPLVAEVRTKEPALRVHPEAEKALSTLRLPRWVRAAAVLVPLAGALTWAGTQLPEDGLRNNRFTSGFHFNPLIFSKAPSERPMPVYLVGTTEMPEIILSAHSPVSAPEPVQQKAGYYIIVGSFHEESNALNWIKQLQAKGNEAFIANGSSSYYRVAVGGFNSEQEARQALTGVQRNIHPGAWIYQPK